MSWIAGYLKTTLFFWKDEYVTFEQLAVLPSFFAGGFYITFYSISGQSPPKVSIRYYIFPVLLVFLLSYYLIGKNRFLLSQKFLKLIRVLILHSIITLLFFVSLLSFHIPLSNLWSLCIASITTSIVLAFHTFKIHALAEHNPFKTKGLYYIWIIITMLLFSVLTSLFSYFCALPNQW